jgi:hypothetical protein
MEFLSSFAYECKTSNFWSHSGKFPKGLNPVFLAKKITRHFDAAACFPIEQGANSSSLLPYDIYN